MFFLLLWISAWLKFWEWANSLRCQNCLPRLLPRLLKTMDPHNQQGLLGVRYINDPRGNASRSRLVLLHHPPPHSWLPRRSNQRRPRGLSGNVRDPAAPRMILLMRCCRCLQPITWCHPCLARRRQLCPLPERLYLLLAWDSSVREVCH